MFKNVVFRVLAGLVLLAAITGIAFFAFNAGLARGTTLDLSVPAVQAGPATGQPIPFYGYGMRFHHPFPLLGFGCFGVLIPLFLLFLAFGAARRMLWGPRFGWRHMHLHHGPWGEKGPGNPDFVPPMFAEWHRRSHESAEKPADDTTKK